jgi:hypothetical protein
VQNKTTFNLNRAAEKHGIVPQGIVFERNIDLLK